MLAAAAPAVKVQDLGTPEQRGCSQAIDQALNTFWILVERLHAAAADQQPIHHVEETIFRQLLVIGRDLLRAVAGPATPRHAPWPALPVHLRRGCHPAGRLRPRSPRSRTVGRPTASA